MTHPYNDHSTAGPLHSDRPALARADRRRLQRHREGLAHLRLGGRLSRRPAAATARRATCRASSICPIGWGICRPTRPSSTGPGQYAGWLGRGYDPLATAIGKRDDNDNPFFRDCTDDELDYRINGLALDEGLSLDRLASRRSLVEQFDDGPPRCWIAAGVEAAYDQFRQRALSLVSSEKVRRALDIRREPAAVRDRYGRHLFGQSTLVGPAAGRGGHAVRHRGLGRARRL